MSYVEIIITVLIFGSILGGIFLIRKSAKKFNLTREQLADIKKRNEMLDKEEKKEQ
ncbi:DUF2897 family protein [Colwellia sp. D2M02]|uniref:DUF2897 domain-containing protein n=1 Tax=Colwellia asteriadis TaxID=517723 RepID=A0ABP3WHX7_9GAMM|nr:DUF2897 family protein [Colwellia sp. D2M02]MBU2892396.1 DUF2897 family protein [Colwellia sp. D2M02]